MPDLQDDGPFVIPEQFLAASRERQAKLRDMAMQRKTAANHVEDAKHSKPTIPATTINQGGTKATSIGRQNKSTVVSSTISSSTPAQHNTSPQRDPPSGSITSPSKTAIAIQQLAQKRAARRAKQDEIRAEGPTEDAHLYRSILASFRKSLKTEQDRLKNHQVDADHRIRVCVRKRPITRKEDEKGHFDITTALNHSTKVHVHEPKVRLDMSKSMDHHQFTFDEVFDGTSSNADIYSATAAPLVSYLFQGAKCTYFAYGQTGSGKTHTIFGSANSPGVYTYACADVFSKLASQQNLSISFFEIYGGRIYDLLSRRERLQMLEAADGAVVINGLKEVQTNTKENMMKWMQLGRDARTTGSTEANAQSSRSHAIFQIVLKEQDEIIGKLSFIDLAGNERGIDTGPHLSRQARLEGSEINKSLLALKECIRAISKNPDGHIPFRASKLTLALRDCFLGKRNRTVMIATVSPGNNATEHTLNTLRYADRVKELKGGKREDSPIQPEANLDEEIETIAGDSVNQDEEIEDEPDFTAEDAEENTVIERKRFSETEVDFLDSYADDIGAALESDYDHYRYQIPISPGLLSPESPKLHAMNFADARDDLPQVFASSSPVLVSLHETVSRILDGEDHLIESHQSVVHGMREVDCREKELLKKIGKPDYDVDEYVDGLEDIVLERIGMLSSLYKKITHFREQLREEEVATAKVTGLANY